MTNAGIYLHIPFCRSRCSYCDFATDVWRDGAAVERYVEVLCREVEGRDPNGREREKTGNSNTASKHKLPDGVASVDSIYFGGGTPSLLTPSQIEKILNSVTSVFSVAVAAEITMEMNPATVTRETLAAYRDLGINRASFGVQTFNDRDLKLLARGHNADDARQTFRMLRDVGFNNISFDLIAGLPGQTLDDWKQNLDEALTMQPEHISLYLLEIHEGTPLANQIRTERRPLPDEDIAAEMYELMLDRLSASGYGQYEISNFSKPGFRSRHNSKYWLLDPVYGYGVSAHSFNGSERYANERDTAKYVEMIETAGTAEVMREKTDLASEFIFLGLRLAHGIELTKYRERFGMDLIEMYQEKIDFFLEADLVMQSDNTLRLTSKGMLYSNEVFEAFI